MSIFSRKDKAKVEAGFESIKEGKFKDDDVYTVIDNTEDILNKSSNGPLEKFFDDIKTMCDMVASWAKKEYREIPYRTIGMIILTLVYVFSPLDIIPDAIPGIGLLDDAMMVGLCLKAVQSDINDFRIWDSRRKRITN